MNFFPMKLVIYAAISSVVFTFLALIGCDFDLNAIVHKVCSFNDFFVKEALDIKVAMFWILACLVPGFIIVFMLFCFSISKSANLVKSRKLVKDKVFLSFGNVKFSNAKVWGGAVYAVIFLFWLMNFLTAKVGSAITGVVLGLVCYLHFFFEKDYSLLFGCFFLAYVLAIYPNYIYWRVSRKA